MTNNRPACSHFLDAVYLDGLYQEFFLSPLGYWYHIHRAATNSTDLARMESY